jgi:2-(1,2-epoxy-1,2-dihydrophenyl)acetyl-CoA isomerase
MDSILFEKKPGVAEIKFNRPDARNAVSAESLIAMRKFAQEIEKDESVKCLVIRGEGEHFMGGADVKAFSNVAELSAAERKEQFEERVQTHAPLFLTLARMPQIVVTAARGAVAGAGLSLVGFSDLSIVGRSAFFVCAQIKIATIPDAGASYILPRHLGVAKAKLAALTGDIFSAEEAERWGLVARVVDDDLLEEETEKLIARIAASPRVALANTKRLLNTSLDRTLPEQLQAEAEAFSDCAAHNDFVEGITAFAEKRKPKF